MPQMKKVSQKAWRLGLNVMCLQNSHHEEAGAVLSTTTETVKACDRKISRGTKAIEGQTEDVCLEEIYLRR